MLHALYFSKASDGSWTTMYNNKFVQTETFKIEKEREKSQDSFLLLKGIKLQFWQDIF